MLLSAGPQGNDQAKIDEVNLHEMEQGEISSCFGWKIMWIGSVNPPTSLPSSKVPFCIAEAGRPKLHFLKPLVLKVVYAN